MKQGTSSMVAAGVLAAGLILGSGGAARAQAPASPVPAALPAPEPSQAAPKVDDPYQAYAGGFFDQALQSFVDQQVERPEDPQLMMNVGASHYKMQNYAEAEKAFAAAALRGDAPLRSKALYNLGNVAYRQGKLQEAIERYQAALEINPNDEDAKFNLEFVRDEIRRRHEEAQKQQQNQQQQQQDQQQQQQEQQDAQSDEQQGEEQQASQDPSAGEENEQQQDPQEQDPQEQDQDSASASDPTEPQDQPGAGEAQQAQQQQPPDDGQQGQAQPAEGQGMSPEEAERYLQALEEGRPQGDQRKARPARRGRHAKDW